MSEYWVSHKKYFCKFCEIYIADDAPSRQQHENGLRHKGNKERFVRGLYKAGEKRKKDLEEEKREMIRIEQAAQAAFAQDLGTGHARPSSSSTAARAQSPSISSTKPPPKKPSNPYENYSTAQSLGFVDPDVEKAKAEAERRQTMGVAGDWQFVPTAQSTSAPGIASEHQDLEAGPSTAAAADAEVKGQKRAVDPQDDEEDARQFKLRKKTWAGGLGELYDPGLIPIKLKAKKEEPQDPVEGDVPSSAAASFTPVVDAAIADAAESSHPSQLPKWTKISWKKASDKEAVASPGMSTEEGSVQTSESVNKTNAGSQATITSTTPTGARDSVKLELVEDARFTGISGNEQSAASVKKEDHGPSVTEKNEEQVSPSDSILKSQPTSSASPPAEGSGGLFRKRKTAATAGTRAKRQF